MSSFEFALIKTLDQARRDLAGLTAPTYAIQARLVMPIPERTLRYYLRSLELRGIVSRPLGHRSGWAVSRAAERGLRAVRAA